MINGVTRSKWEGLGYSRKYFNPRFETLSKPIDPSSSSSTQKGLNSYFVPAAETTKIMNQSEPKVVESRVLKKSEPKTLKSKVLKKPKPKTLGAKVLKGSEPKAKIYSRQQTFKSKFLNDPKPYHTRAKVQNKKKPFKTNPKGPIIPIFQNFDETLRFLFPSNLNQ